MKKIFLFSFIIFTLVACAPPAAKKQTGTGTSLNQNQPTITDPPITTDPPPTEDIPSDETDNDTTPPEDTPADGTDNNNNTQPTPQFTTKIIYESYRTDNIMQNGKLMMMNADGSNKIELVSDHGFSMGRQANAKASPNGEYIIFSSPKEGSEEVWLLQLNTRTIRRLSSFNAASSWLETTEYAPCSHDDRNNKDCFSWSFDNKEIVFSVQPQFRGFSSSEKTYGNQELYKLDLTQTLPTPIKFQNQPNANNINPQFSPKDKQIAFVSSNISNPSFETETQNHKLLLIGLDGQIQTLVETNSMGSIQWSPDGTKIAFVQSIPNTQDRKASYIDLQTRQVHILGEQFRTQVSDGESSWSPDGKYIIFISQTPEQILNADSSLNIYTLSNQSLTTIIGLEKGIKSAISWLNNSEVMYRSYTSTGNFIYKTSITTPHPQKLTDILSDLPGILRIPLPLP